VSRLNNSSGGPFLCYVTDRRSLLEGESREAYESLMLKIGAAAAAGVDWIQIREKDLSGADCGWVTRETLRRFAKSQASNAAATRVLVNDRVDVALFERAAGVHLGLAGAQAQSRDFLIGVSCHSLEAARTAASGGADYLFFGPTFATPSKAAYGAPQGLALLAEVCREVPIPVLAIGGITVANASACLAAGASGIAAIRLFQEALDILSLVQSLRKLAP
jgi:thiamine-phosphate pyrophosphorylase